MRKAQASLRTVMHWWAIWLMMRNLAVRPRVTSRVRALSACLCTHIQIVLSVNNRTTLLQTLDVVFVAFGCHEIAMRPQCGWIKLTDAVTVLFGVSYIHIGLLHSKKSLQYFRHKNSCLCFLTNQTMTLYASCETISKLNETKFSFVYNFFLLNLLFIFIYKLYFFHFHECIEHFSCTSPKLTL